MRKHIIAGLIATAGGLPACASSVSYVVRGTERSIGVDGLITIEPQSEDVNLVSVDLVNLPPPERHDRRKRVFVVWLTPVDSVNNAEKKPIRAGRLAYDAGARAGHLRATTPNDLVYVQITAEEDSAAESPSDFVVISKQVTLKRPGDANSAGL
jgi:hypothetical protein